MADDQVSDRTIARLSAYRRVLDRFIQAGQPNVYSYQIASASGATPAQVRRDLMAVGYSGSPNRGYKAAELAASIGEFLDNPAGDNAGLVGVGNLGRAILAFFSGRRPRLSIAAAFDVTPEKVDRTVHGCRCYSIEQFPAVASRLKITIGIICTPADAAQKIAETMVESGVRGILNFAPVALKLPPWVFTEDIDMTTALEKVAYFARKMPQG
jgi:redox-sensing transcriptional repressor